MNYTAGYDLVSAQTLQGLQNMQASNALLKSYYPSSMPLLGTGYPILTQTPQHQISPCSPQLATHLTNVTCSSPNLQVTQQQELLQQNKKFRPPLKSALSSRKYIPKPIPEELGNLKTYSNPDILICGNCKELFEDLVDMLDHKKNFCKMRFTCKCDYNLEGGDEEKSPSQQAGVNTISSANDSKVRLKCTQCKETFRGAWALVNHAQKTHNLKIFNTGGDENIDQPGGNASPEKSCPHNVGDSRSLICEPRSVVDLQKPLALLSTPINVSTPNYSSAFKPNSELTN